MTDMASLTCLKLAPLAMTGLLAACESLAPPLQQAAREARVSDRPAPTCSRDARDTLDSYKAGVARHILRSNLGHTFDDDLAPQLPAIVVVRLSVDSAGELTDVAVQRAPGATAAEEALASIRRSGTFPLPCGLIVRPSRTLTIYETFLFNTEYQFQLRSLAGTH
jgi:protein TonB